MVLSWVNKQCSTLTINNNIGEDSRRNGGITWDYYVQLTTKTEICHLPHKPGAI
jgi:hypothetical protein